MITDPDSEVFRIGAGQWESSTTQWSPSRTAAVLPGGRQIEAGGAGSRGAFLARFADGQLYVATRLVTSHLEISTHDLECPFQIESPHRTRTGIERNVRYRCGCGSEFTVRPLSNFGGDYKILETYREVGIRMEHTLTYVRAREAERPCEHWLPLAL